MVGIWTLGAKHPRIEDVLIVTPLAGGEGCGYYRKKSNGTRFNYFSKLDSS